MNCEQKMNLYMEKIANYSLYVDCLARVIDDYVENGDYNLKPCDIPNLCYCLEKLAYRLRCNIVEMKNIWEFRKFN